MSKKTKHYKPNLTYVLLIDDIFYYAGCHAQRTPFLRENEIISCSGCPFKQKDGHKVEIIQVTEYDSKEEAQDAEIGLIADCKEKYGDKCLNIYLGNKLGAKGVPVSIETREKLSKALKGKYTGENSSFYGKHHSEETRKKLSLSKMGEKNPMYGKKTFWYGKHLPEDVRKKLSESKKGQIPWNKGIPMKEESKLKASLNSPKRGMTWYTNGQVNIMAKECPDGFWKGKTVSEETRRKIAVIQTGRPYKESSKEKQRIKMAKLKWYTNGQINVRKEECPEGFYPGRTPKRKVS